MEVILDAIKDSAIVFPFVFLIYILMEVIEGAKDKEKIEKSLSGPFAPLYAGAVGLVPECGFSVMCAKLYDSGLIKIGTLITAFIVTSDEGLIILISERASIKAILGLLAYKIVFGIIIGEILNLVLSKFDKAHVCPLDGDCIECGEHHSKKIDKYFLHPLTHALKTFIYILVLNLIFGYAIYFIGEEQITDFMGRSEFLQPLFTVMVGLIPNCASSMILAEGYVNGVVNFAGLLAGLCTNAGLGILMLFKNKKNLAKNFLILFIMIISGIVIGYISLILQNLF